MRQEVTPSAREAARRDPEHGGRVEGGGVQQQPAGGEAGLPEAVDLLRILLGPLMRNRPHGCENREAGWAALSNHSGAYPCCPGRLPRSV